MCAKQKSPGGYCQMLAISPGDFCLVTRLSQAFTLERQVQFLFEQRTELYIKYSEGVVTEENCAWRQELFKLKPSFAWHF
jgi:hypothetical protein